MSLALLPWVTGTWDQSKITIQSDLNLIQIAVNTLGASIQVAGGTFNPALVPGNSTIPTRYITNEGPGNAPQWGQVNLSNGVFGALPVGNGGIGITGYAVGDLLYASAATTLSRLADVAVGSALISGGVGVAPAWGNTLSSLVVSTTGVVVGALTVGPGGSGTTGGVFQVNGGSGAHSYAAVDFYLNSALKGELICVESAGDYAPGAVSGDIILRGQNQKLLFTADNGTSNPLVINLGTVGIGTATPTASSGSSVLLQINSATYLDNLIAVTLGSNGSSVTGTTNAIFNRIDVYEALDYTATTAFIESFGVFHNQTAGHGNRNACAFWLTVSGGTRIATTLSSAAIFKTTGEVPLGSYFGSNPYCLLTSTALGLTSGIGEEINTDIECAITGYKIGLQIVDVAVSTGAATGPNIALRFVNQLGAYGFAQGILFDAGDGAATSPSVRSTGTLIQCTGGSYAVGMDFGAATFSGAGITLPNLTYYAARDSIGVASGVVNLDGNGIVNIGGSTSGGANSATAGAALVFGRLGFPSTPNPSTNAHVLDQYQEGTWTPTDASGASLSITVNTATYVKIGQFVHFTMDITFPITADTHNVQIGGLPFTAGAANYAAYQGYGGFANQWYTAASGTSLYAYHAGTVTPTTNVSLSTLELVVSGCYRASA